MGSENVTMITRKTIRTLWKTIWIHKNDHLMLRNYRTKYKISMTAVLHMLLGVGAKCLEEKHLQEIAYLKQQLGYLAGVVLVYRRKYGNILPVSD
ncbi:hypothetical protein ACFLWS_05235 [Chloroflexota bacterium]